MNQQINQKPVMPGRKITHGDVDHHLAEFNIQVAAGTCGSTGTFEEYVEALCWYVQTLHTAGQLDRAWELPADWWLRRYYNLARTAIRRTDRYDRLIPTLKKEK